VKKNMRHNSLTALSLVLLLMAGGCKTTDTPIAGKALNSLNGMHDELQARFSTSASNAIAEGKTEEALALYKRLYSESRGDEDVALNYAQLLRKTGKPQEAMEVLHLFVHDRRGNLWFDAEPVMLNEYAAASIEVGDFPMAEKILDAVLNNKSATAFHADAHNLRGVILDAKGEHKEAEQHFRDALDGWKGDDSSVMNNLAICLASQGRFDEALVTLRQALVKAPHKPEIASNIQLISDLKKSVAPEKAKARVKKPHKKKVAKPAPAAEPKAAAPAPDALPAAAAAEPAP
jgi:Flp pilus assembly protein TadD